MFNKKKMEWPKGLWMATQHQTVAKYALNKPYFLRFALLKATVTYIRV